MVLLMTATESRVALWLQIQLRQKSIKQLPKLPSGSYKLIAEVTFAHTAYKVKRLYDKPDAFSTTATHACNQNHPYGHSFKERNSSNGPLTFGLPALNLQRLVIPEMSRSLV